MLMMMIVGYLGVDCSLNATVPPQVIGLRAPGSMCDVRGPTACTAVSLYASGFSLTTNFTCRVVSHYTFYHLLTLISSGGGGGGGGGGRGPIP